MAERASRAWRIRPLGASDRGQVDAFALRHWGSLVMVSRGVVHRLRDLHGFVAVSADEWLGLVTYQCQGRRMEVVSLDSSRPGQGIGSALLARLEKAAAQEGCHVIWLITTNDNLPALSFYLRRGYLLVATHRGAVNRARRLKPEIPRLGIGGVPIQDELELAKELAPTRSGRRGNAPSPPPDAERPA